MITLRPYQQECIDIINSKESGRYLVQLATGLGKCFAAGTKILMYDGSTKNVEDLKPGDLIMGWDSTPRKVKSLAHGSEMMYEVSRCKHDSYTVNESHILSLKITGLNSRKVTDCFGRAYKSGDICNIEVKDYLKCSLTFKHVAKGFCMPVEFKTKEVPVEPYFLGIWLGDGHSRNLQITTPDKEVVEYLEGFAERNNLKLSKDRAQNAGAATTYSLTCNSKHNHRVRKYIKENLFLNKHIPHEYLANSTEMRMELLAGLIDTDGYLVKGKDDKHSNYEFCTQYEHLQKQFSFLCRGLGFTAIEHKKYNKKYEKYYFYVIVSGNIETIPVKVQRKKAEFMRPNKDNLKHGINVKPVGIGEYYGFELEGKDRMFLLGDCTVAHNTVVFTNILRKGRMLILSHREELVRQPLKYFDCSTGVELAGESSHGEEVVSASVQTMIHRLDCFGAEDFDTIIVDEAHHAIAKSYQKVIGHFKPRMLLGFTATPNRADGAGLKGVFDEIIYKKDLRWGIQNGYLCDILCKRIDIGYDLSAVHTRMGDYAPGELEKAMDGTADAIAQTYKDHAQGATLIFAVSVDQCYEIAERIEGAEVVTGQTKNRAELIARFTRREIPCLVNCMVFTEGTDMPLVETVIVARPTKSDSLYAQMVGRGLRLHPEKKMLTLIDCVGVTGKASLCTAPSLLGVDIEKIPKKKQDSMEGMLFELPEKAKRLADTPESWIENVRIVDLWAKEMKYQLHGVNWFQMPDGTMICSLPNKMSVEIPPADELGETIFCGQRMEMQEAFDHAYELLCSNFADSKAIWDKNISAKWGSQPASEAQVKYVKRIAKKYLSEIDFDTLTKAQAGMIINRIKGGTR